MPRVLPPYPAPPEGTALRLGWRFLPPTLRAWIEDRCGSPVVTATSQDAGFTPAFASVLTCEDGSRHFVKAASVQAQRAFAESYREEGRILACLPPSVPAPRLLWSLDEDWVVLGLEHVDATMPERPWRLAQLEAALDALEVVAQELDPVQVPGLSPAADEFGPIAGHWPELAVLRPDLVHHEAAGALAAELTEVAAGTCAVHTDIRADNLLVRPDGGVSICDWNWVVQGAPWLDSVMLLAQAYGDGVDVERHLGSRPLLADVSAEDVDRLLAALSGQLLTMGSRPTVVASPYLRAHQRWQGEACWSWLSRRRGWA